MSNRFFVAFGVESNLSSSKGPTNFEQRTHSNDLLSSRWFAQEVDCQASGHLIVRSQSLQGGPHKVQRQPPPSAQGQKPFLQDATLPLQSREQL